jgi:hypothetical protein
VEEAVRIFCSSVVRASTRSEEDLSKIASGS